MKKRISIISAAALSLAGLFSLSACNVRMMGFTSYAYFNTSAQWAFGSTTQEATDSDKEVWLELLSLFGGIENSISTEVAGSSIEKFNRAEAGERVEIDYDAYTVLGIAQKMYRQTDGAYNPAIGMLVDLWGFSPRFSSAEFKPDQPYDRPTYTQLPDPVYIEAFKNLSDFSQVALSEEGGSYYALKPETAKVELPDQEGNLHTYTMQLNLGGIGKGYAVDCAEKLVRSKGYDYGWINLGGSSLCLLKNSREDHTWSISVNNPRLGILQGDSYIKLTEKDVSLSSSGDYENYYEVWREDGEGRVRYCHIINPATGYPVNAEPTNADGSGIVTASVFGLTAAEGDATSTALMVMGKDRALEYAAEYLADREFAFLYYDGTENTYTVYTNVVEGKIELLDGQLRLERVSWR